MDYLQAHQANLSPLSKAGGAHFVFLLPLFPLSLLLPLALLSISPLTLSLCAVPSVDGSYFVVVAEPTTTRPTGTSTSNNLSPSTSAATAGNNKTIKDAHIVSGL